jgi:hypothetical protein
MIIQTTIRSFTAPLWFAYQPVAYRNETKPSMGQKKARRGEGYTTRINGRKTLTSNILEERLEESQRQYEYVHSHTSQRSCCCTGPAVLLVASLLIARPQTLHILLDWPKLLMTLYAAQCRPL